MDAPSPSTLPPGVASLARSMGLGELVSAAEQVIGQAQGEHPQGLTDDREVLRSLAQVREELQQLRVQLLPLAQLAQQLAPLLQLPKVQQQLRKAQTKG